MTTKEKLKLVEKQIREDIPRLMELREGCLVYYNDEVFKIAKRALDFHILVYHDNFESFQPFTKRIHEYDINSDKIIGHDIMLNDVLEWLLLNNYYAEISNDNFLFVQEKYINGTCGIGMGRVEIDLSSPYLKDQSEELIDFLYSLIRQ